MDPGWGPVVAVTGDTDSTPRGPAIDVFNFGGSRCQTLPATPPKGPPSTSSTSEVAAAGPAASTPQGAHHRSLQLRWWPLTDLVASTPRGPAIDVFNFGGGRYRTCRQHPQGPAINVSNF
jgi:hypothetical protein